MVWACLRCTKIVLKCLNKKLSFIYTNYIFIELYFWRAVVHGMPLTLQMLEQARSLKGKRSVFAVLYQNKRLSAEGSLAAAQRYSLSAPLENMQRK